MSKKVGKCVIDARTSGCGEAYTHTTAIMQIFLTLDKSAIGEPVNAIGHSAAGDQGLSEELSGGQGVWLASATQRGEYVELPRLQLVRVKGSPACSIEVAGEPGHT